MVGNKKVEHKLKDLINDRNNSNKCGECGTDYPTWASVNLGVFLCGRCASVHRKLGPEISEVKSLTLDKWYESDLDFLASIGNKRALHIWNPKKEPFPFDDDDKEEIFQYLRKKYVLGKYRYDPPTEEDYNFDAGRYNEERNRSSSRPSSLRNSSFRNSVPLLSYKDIPEMQRLKYRKLEPELQSKGFRNNDNNYEALSLAKGDLNLAVKILENSSSSEHKPTLPKRPGASNNITTRNDATSSISAKQTQVSTSNWWNPSDQQTIQPTSTAQTFPIDPQTGLLEPPQQFLDPNTGIIYVDPVHQQQYLQQQEYLQLQQGMQVTGMNKNQLMSLYNNTGYQQNPVQSQFQQQQFQQQFGGYQQGFNGF